MWGGNSPEAINSILLPGGLLVSFALIRQLIDRFEGRSHFEKNITRKPFQLEVGSRKRE